MKRLLLLPALLLCAAGGPAAPGIPAEIRGQYVEARTCDVYTGACFANADTGPTGRNAVLVWKIDSGTIAGAKLDGLGVIAVVSANESLGLRSPSHSRAIIIVDEKANAQQSAALVSFVKARAGDLTDEVVAVRTAPIEMAICTCDGNGCATVKAGDVRISTRCLDSDHDRACGNETSFYPPLTAGVTVKPAMAAEHSFSGKGLNETWSDSDRRGAYVGSFVSH